MVNFYSIYFERKQKWFSHLYYSVIRGYFFGFVHFKLFKIKMFFLLNKLRFLNPNFRI